MITLCQIFVIMASAIATALGSGIQWIRVKATELHNWFSSELELEEEL